MERRAIQLHMVPKYISRLEVELSDSLYGIAKSVTLLETASAWNEGMSFLFVVVVSFCFLCVFFSFLPKKLQKVLGNKLGILFRNCTEDRDVFSIIKPVLTIINFRKMMCYRSAEAKIPAVPNNLQFAFGLKIPISCLSSGQWKITLSIISQTAYVSLLSISGKYVSLTS